ncbi:HAD family hydrolase [Paramicrobacterium chengjingii]|uniref:HAD family hydrolase n=1 Tax=Paramicrobacterium chengjingii TaxID=2769067 RepID=A0ABX6YHG3_9MICO|nr:HAD family hydrolase [Microbacterium chengjingii]QPZ38228.1 HAD family hydrolase [Microbacterium chengjingii]
MTSHIDAVIFDCDGVLVDSEVLTMTVGQRVLADLGWHVELSTLIEMFVGCTHEYYVEQVEKNLGRKLEDDWSLPYRPWYDEAFAEDLREIEGISDAVERIALPTAVASNSDHERIRSSLTTVGLFDRFDGRICSAEDVPDGKPAPDVYLKAAETLGVAPERCIAVEDSNVGVQAARAAGMTVLAYETDMTPAGWFDRPDITVFRSMADLPALVDELSN